MSTEEETTPVAAEGAVTPAEDGGGAESVPVVEEESTATFEPVVCFFPTVIHYLGSCSGACLCV